MMVPETVLSGRSRRLKKTLHQGRVFILLPGDTVLDGGITLKPGQKLIGIVEEGVKPRLTNSTANQEGVAVLLATGNEVRNLALRRSGDYGHPWAGT